MPSNALSSVVVALVAGAFVASVAQDPRLGISPSEPRFHVVPSAPPGAAAASAISTAPALRRAPAPEALLRGFTAAPHGTGDDVRFVARVDGAWHGVADDGLRLVKTAGTRGVAVRLTVEGPRGPAVGEGALPGAFHFLRGSDATSSTRDARVFDRVRLTGGPSGADVVVRERDGRLAYDVELRPGLRLADVVFRVDGGSGLTVDADGALVVATDLGDLRHREPVAWRVEADGGRSPVRCSFRVIDATRFGFRSTDDADDDPRPLVVDPSLDWCGYLGGSSLDELFAVDVDPSGAAYFAGRSLSPDFPATAGAFDASLTAGNFDAVVAKVNAAGTALVYATFLGGSGTDRAEAIRVNAAGEAHVCGHGGSGWPVTAGAYKTTYGGQGDAVVAKLAASGATLVYSTYVGGTAEDRAHALALDAAGAVFVAGETLSTTSFGTTSSSILATTDSIGTWNAFVAKLQPSGAAISYAVRFGGSGLDWVSGIEVDAAGVACVAGATTSPNFGASGGGLNLAGTNFDAYVAKINAAGSAFQWTARLGGPGPDQANGLALAADGTAYVVGGAGISFPTTTGAHRTVGDGGDAFALRLASNGAALLYSTYFGGTSTEAAISAALDAAGRLYVGGYTNSADFPTTPGALSPTFRGGGAPAEGFVVKLAPTAASLAYASFVGGTADDTVHSVRLAGNGVLWVAGSTQSVNLPTTGGVGAAAGISYEGFGMKMTLPKSASAVAFGAGYDAAAPFPSLVCAEPAFGAPLTMTIAFAPPSTSGFVFVAPEAAPPVAFGTGCLAYGQLAAALLVAAPMTDATGAWSGGLPPLPPSPALEGLTLVAQGAFLDATAPVGLALTNGVRLTFGY